MKELKDSPNKFSSSWREVAQGKKPKKASKKNLKKSSIYKIGGYIRLSPSDEIREEGSLVSHPQQIKSFVELKNSHTKNWGEIVEWYTDKDYSGGNMNRPAFKRMCSDIISGHINAIIVTELSRLNRNVKDFCQFWDFVQRHNVKLISLKENFDTSTPAGEMMVLSIINFAQFERKNIVQRIKNGSRSRAERGLANSGVPVLGYNSHSEKTCHLVINEKEKVLVQLIFNKYIELGTLAKTCEYLNQKGYKTKEYMTKAGKPYGGHRWTRGSLQRTLTNLVYIGKRELNKESRHLDQETLKEEDRYQVFEAQWESLVSEEIFYNIQSILENNKRETRRYVHNYRLRGFVHCKECGEKLIGKSGNGRSGKYYYYGHKRTPLIKGDRHKQRCILENIPAVSLEEAVLSGLKRLKEDEELLKNLVLKANTGRSENTSYLDGLLQSVKEKHKAAKESQEGIITAIAAAPKSKSTQVLMKKLEELETQKEVLEEEIEKLTQERKQSSSNVIDLKSAFSLLRGFNKEFHKQPSHQQRELLKNILRKVVVGRDGVWIECYGMAPSPSVSLESENFPIKTAWTPLRSQVRPLSQLVGSTGIEPMTSTL